MKTHISQQLKQGLLLALEDLNLPTVKFDLTHPTDPSHGDYATNLALVLFGQLSPAEKQHYSNPRALAEVIANAPALQKLIMPTPTSQLPDLDAAVAQPTTFQPITTQPACLSAVAVAGPGFINFTLSEHFLLEEMQQLLTDRAHFVSAINQGKKVIVEFTDPNPFKQFHIGHLYVNIIGESICRLLEATGAQVRRANYYGDVGMHAAKSIWGALQKIVTELSQYPSVTAALDHLATQPLIERARFLGEAYALGSNRYTDDESAKHEIERLNKLLYVVAQDLMIEELNWQPLIDYRQFLDEEHRALLNLAENEANPVAAADGSPRTQLSVVFAYTYHDIKQLFQLGREWSLAEFETIYQRVGMHFDSYYPESHVAEYGIQLVQEGLSKGIFTKSDGAIIYEGKKHGLHNRVFINSSGLPTYEAKELGLAPAKYADEPYDFSLIIIGTDLVPHQATTWQ